MNHKSRQVAAMRPSSRPVKARVTDISDAEAPPIRANFAAPVPARRRNGQIKVRAIERVYHDHVLRRPGSVFFIHSMAEFTSVGMVLADRHEKLESVSANSSIKLGSRDPIEASGVTVDEDAPLAKRSDSSVI